MDFARSFSHRHVLCTDLHCGSRVYPLLKLDYTLQVAGTISRRSLLRKESASLSPESIVVRGSYGEGAYGEGAYGEGAYGEKRFVGDLTYYGGAGDQGMCSQSHVPPGFTTVAINAPQFYNGPQTSIYVMKCGTCVHACFDDLGLGQGERCFDAIIDNVCPECAEGDLDLGEDGDGRWPVEWDPILCPVRDEIVTTQGSNPWYGKVKVEGGPSALHGMFCTDSQGVEYKGDPTPDGFWEFNSGSGAFECGLECQVTFTCCYSIWFVTVEPELFGGDGSGC